MKLEHVEVHAAEVMDVLKFVEASDVPEEFILETVAASEALNTSVTGIYLDLISEDYFYYTTLNHIYPTPSPIPSPNQSPKHYSLPVDETTNAHNQLIKFYAYEQPSVLNTMLESPIYVSSGKNDSSIFESECDAEGFEAHLNLKSTKSSSEIIKPISVIPIQIISPQGQPSNLSCTNSKFEHVIHVQPKITFPSETQPPSQSSPQHLLIENLALFRVNL